MMKLFFSSLQPLTLLSLFIFSLVPETVQSSECGLKKSPMQGQTRISNGQEAKVNEWPWMVSLTKLGVFDQHLCGGAVIGKRWIITAAHCLVKFDGSPRYREYKEDIRIYLGDHDLNDASETDKVEVYKVDYFKAHEKYEKIGNKNDIAVIKVSKDIDLSRHTPVCLSPRNRTYEGSQAMATSWEYMSSWGLSSDERKPQVLQEVSLKIHDSDGCPRGAMSGKLCAGGEGASVCFGDGGAPLTIEGRTGKHTLVGVSSRVRRRLSCRVNTPDYFTDVSYYRDWIKEKTGI